MGWFGVIRDSESIAEWQRADASARRDPQRAVAERFGRWFALPVIATGAIVLAVIPGAVVPASEAATSSRSTEVAADLGGAVLGAGPLSRDQREQPAEVVAAAAATARPEKPIDAAAAAALVARLDGVHGPAGALGEADIPVTALAAYRHAADVLARTDPSCHLPWWLLAGIGRIESGHASGGRVTADGTTRGRILGVRLDGSLAGTSVIADSDGGALDGDPLYDRAVGPMQFLPSTWQRWGRDGNDDGVRDPDNIFDAALGAGAYLCAGGRDLSTDAGIAAAVLSYNYSQSYLASVVMWGTAYRDGVTPVGDGSGDVPPPATVPPTTVPPTTRPPTSTRPTTPPTTTSPTTPPTSTPPPTTPPTTTPPTTPPTTTPPTTTPPTPPVLVADTTTGDQGAVQTVSPLANDRAATHGTKLDWASFTLLDASGAAVSSLTVDGEGTYVVSRSASGPVVTFTPVAGFSGTATPVTYRVADTEKATATSTYTPEVTPTEPTDPPTGSPIGSATGPAGSAASSRSTPPAS